MIFNSTSCKFPVPRRKAPGRSRSRDTIARYEPVDPFAPEHQALFLPQSMPGERPYRAGGAEKRRRPSRGPRSDRSTDYFERNSRYTDSNTRSRGSSSTSARVKVDR